MNDIEQQFFKVFGINKRCCHDNYKHQKEVCHRIPEQCQDYQYPEITDRVLLELICLLSQYFYLFEDLHVKTVSELKDCVLQKCITTIIDDTDEIQQIQQLFKEEE